MRLGKINVHKRWVVTHVVDKESGNGEAETRKTRLFSENIQMQDGKKVREDWKKAERQDDEGIKAWSPTSHFHSAL